MSIEGIYAAAITPMDESGAILYQSLKEIVAWELSKGVEGFYVGGSSGEGLLLSIEERKKVLETVIEAVDGRVPVIAHTGTIRTADVIDLSKHAQAAGVAAVSMIPPYYYNFSLEEIIGYYEDVMQAISIPAIIYNIPAFTGIAFNKKNSHRLLAREQLIGIKHTSMNLYDLERMKQAYPEKIYFNGYDEIFLSGLAAGATSAVGTTVNLFSDKFKEIRSLYTAGDMHSAAAVQQSINTAIEAFVEAGIFNAVKFAFTQLGIPSGSCRKPFSPLTEASKVKLLQILTDLQVL